MKIETYFKKNYPDDYTEILSVFDAEHLELLKKKNYYLGRFNKDVIFVDKYALGTLCIWFKVKTDTEVLTKAFVKCKDGLTQSGYHLITVNDEFIDVVA